jgi:hypothetical protein
LPVAVFAFVKGIDRHEAAATLERLAEGRPGLDPSALALIFAKPTLLSLAQCGMSPQHSMSRLRSPA